MKNSPNVRYYFWAQPKGRSGKELEWHQLGRNEGYDTLEELKKDCTFYFEYSEDYNVRILKAELFAEEL